MNEKREANDPAQTATVRGENVTLFSEPPEESSSRGLIFGVIALAILAIAGGLFMRGHDAAPTPPPNTILPADPAAVAIVLSQPVMSESTSLSGGKSTFLDGHIKNTGTATLAGATVQAVFHNDVNMPPAVESIPLTIIHMREPYIDTVPLSSAPLKTGQEAEFRLIFENVPDNWNQQMPEFRIVHATLQ